MAYMGLGNERREFHLILPLRLRHQSDKETKYSAGKSVCCPRE
jgi:hypothetical protein